MSDFLRSIVCRVILIGVLAFTPFLTVLNVSAVYAEQPASAGLKVEDFQLFNGDGGSELWRLRADWGNLTHNGDNIDLERPVVRYTLGNPVDNDYVYVTANNGRVTDNRRTVTLWGDVKVVHGNEVVVGSLLEYSSQSGIMEFSKGAVIVSPLLTSKMTVFRWHLADNILEGERGVETVLKPSTGKTSAE